ncbi:MAG: Nucleotide sugar dehydrogenase [Frankiales bacterium]|nr:Nucleotide sugar dehydrogenase [Frankiales bacterium]
MAERDRQPKKLAVVGQGYVGLPLAMRAVEVGYSVVGVELDAARAKRLLAADSYVEDVPSQALRSALDRGRYVASGDYADADGFDIAVITVPTPLREGVPDLSYIDAAAGRLARCLSPGATVVLESTTYPGTTEELLCPVLEAVSGLSAGRDFHVGYSPERIDPGNATYGMVDIPKVVSGIDEASLRAVRAFYDDLVGQTVPVSSCRVAELTKLLENTFRHVNIALVNELAMFAADLGLDLREAIAAASTKPFGFMPFTPGPGVGGHCLPIDPSYLSWRVKRSTGHNFRFVELANDINDHMPEYVVRRSVLALNRRHLSVNGSRILLLGLSYKKDIGDVREAPAIRVAELLWQMGAQVRAADPYVDGDVPFSSPMVRVELSPDEVSAADLVVLLTDHTVWDLAVLHDYEDKVFDTRDDTRLKGVERL